MQPRKILTVDDSPLIHKMYDVILRDFPLVHAMDGVEALQLLGKHLDVDLVLLDINMPRMDGLQFLAYMKANPVFQRIPVIIISTEGSDEDTVRGLKAGAAGYIRKPFQNETVRDMIARLAQPRE